MSSSILDDSVNASSSAPGFIIRDDQSNLILANTFNIGICSVYVAEASSLLMGIKAALALNIRKILIEGDNLLVINAVNRIWSPPWTVDHLIKQILVLLHQFDYWEIRHIFREANQAADWISNVGHLIESSMEIQDLSHSRLSLILQHDASGMLYSRNIS